ncbi:hypothetical protein YC2023_045116 [Brassica napus]
MDLTEPRGQTDMGIDRSDMVLTALTKRRRRNHQSEVLISIEQNLRTLVRSDSGDETLWKGKNNVYMSEFITWNTWNHVRSTTSKVSWHKSLCVEEAGSEPLWTPLLYRLVYYLEFLSQSELDRVSLFLARYAFQAAIHTTVCHSSLLDTRSKLQFTQYGGRGMLERMVRFCPRRKSTLSSSTRLSETELCHYKGTMPGLWVVHIKHGMELSKFDPSR